ncbi:MAG: carboxymuconolactone decarboxylase family protein [Bacteroidia bacterium]
MTTFNVPTRDQVSTNNQVIFDDLKGKLGMVPNLYATYAFSDVALEANLEYSHRFEASKSFKSKEIQAIYLAVSQTNECTYCLAAHTALGKMAGFTEEETVALRDGSIADSKLKVLVDFAREVTLSRGKPSQEKLEAFFDAGYNNAQLIDLLGFVAAKTFANYVHNITKSKVDFPEAKPLPALATV